MIGPHTQLIRARIAFSHAGLSGDHSWIAKSEGERTAPCSSFTFARRGIDSMPSGEIALHWAASMEDQMLRLAKELDELETQYAALDSAMSATGDDR
ncbi:hypothetical protein WK57_11295 [Burkholderia ubonensis]|uniref:Uncharacterized protein n=1 Tax=Burkholderia ubonensis TaxID=101571 RepID=A0AA40RD63_9BURK|nr:hypothetical protein [Burkholderia ubonensis]KVD43403.1 hypothetical protein WI85_28285 [Burkholderia ubonensis]KVD79287.1 hypothetical protein WI89_29185 [Burkholderia ubonensis]KWZ61086.1 hypothetical protein WK57_11295 [Burkholderia ubonensis]